MAEDEANRISAGVKVWVADPAEAYVAGSVVSVHGETVKVAIASGETELKHADLCLVENADREDMVTLNYLHEPGVLDNLKNRYGRDEIYTYTGNILIAVRNS
jgi:myosin-5